jgi:hypothetical protein
MRSFSRVIASLRTERSEDLPEPTAPMTRISDPASTERWTSAKVKKEVTRRCGVDVGSLWLAGASKCERVPRRRGKGSRQQTDGYKG